MKQRTNMATKMLQDLRKRQANILAQSKADFFNNQKVETTTRNAKWSR